MLFNSFMKKLGRRLRGTSAPEKKLAFLTKKSSSPNYKRGEHSNARNPGGKY